VTTPIFGRPRWGHQVGFGQPGRAAFWLYLLLLLPTGAYFLLEQGYFATQAPGSWLVSWGLLALYAVPVFVAVYLLDLFEREPISLLVAALVWGGVIAIGFSALANEIWGLAVAGIGGPDFAAEWGAALTAPVIEETYKFLGLVVIAQIARAEIDDLMDGFVFGALIGLGFTVVEDVSYFVSTFVGELSADLGGELPAVLLGFYLRVVASGLYGHVLYTALAGIGLAYFLTRRGQESLVRRLFVLLALLGAAIGGHFLWNSPLLDLYPAWPWEGVAELLLVLLASAIKGLPLLIFVALLVKLARRRERRWLRGALESELGLGGLTGTELGLLEDPGRDRDARRALAAAAGAPAVRALRRLQRAQITLAMVRTRVETADHPDLARQRERCRELRGALRALPGVAATDLFTSEPAATDTRPPLV
jgi:RsiW-degrading membrane proteinase PrsW (M82 family)